MKLAYSPLEAERLRQHAEQLGRRQSACKLIANRLNREFHGGTSVRTADGVRQMIHKHKLAENLRTRHHLPAEQKAALMRLLRKYGSAPDSLPVIAGEVGLPVERVRSFFARRGKLGLAPRARKPRQQALALEATTTTVKMDAARVRELVARAIEEESPLAAKVKDGRLRRAWRRVREWLAA